MCIRDSAPLEDGERLFHVGVKLVLPLGKLRPVAQNLLGGQPSLLGDEREAQVEMGWVLEQAPGIWRPILCLDHDAAGIEDTGRLKEILSERGYSETAVLQSIHKDWNEDVKPGVGWRPKARRSTFSSWRRRRSANESAP